MKYCTRCLMPDSKPYIQFDDRGVCNACQNSDIKKDALNGIDWTARHEEFVGLINAVKARKAPVFDAVVPVSGGKDSMTQVARLLPFGLRILAVNVDYGIKTDIGRENLDALADMGVQLMIFTPRTELHKRLIVLGLEDFGDPDLMSHCMLHAFPLRVALNFQVPLVWLGENSAFEYGGAAAIANQTGMTRAWFEKFAANSDWTPRKVAEHYDIPYEQLAAYDFPDRIQEAATQTMFMSHFFQWDSKVHLDIATKHGFKALPEPHEGTYRNYVGIDEKINRIHQYLKVLKFGYGRACDHACEDIRNGHLNREEAKALVRAHDLQPLSDGYADSFCAFTGMDRGRFDAVIERYRNQALWQKDDRGNWMIPGHLEDR